MNRKILRFGMQGIVAFALLFTLQFNVGEILAQDSAGLEDLQVITPDNVGELELIRWVGQGTYSGKLAQQVDGNLIAAVTSSGVKLLDRERGEQTGFIPIGLRPTALSISPDGSTLAVVTALPTGELGGFMGLPRYLQQIELYALPDGEKTGEAITDLGECGGSMIWGMAFTPDGSELAFVKAHGVNESKELCVLSLDEENVTRTREVSQNAEIAVSPLGDYFVVADRQAGKLSVFSAADFSQVRELEISKNYYTILFSGNGQYLGLLNSEEAFRVWSLEDGNLLFSGNPSDEDDTITAFDVSDDGSRIYLGTYLGQVEIVNVSDGQVESQLGPFTWTGYSLTGNPGGVTSFAHPASLAHIILSADGSSLTLSEDLISYGQSGDIHIFELPAEEEIFTFRGPALVSEGPEMAFSPDSSKVALTGSQPGMVEIYNTGDGEKVMELSGHTQVANQVLFSPDGRWIATCSDDTTIHLWDAQTGDLVRNLSGHEARVNRMAFSPDSTWLVSGADDNTIRRWNVADGRLLGTHELGDENWRVDFLAVMKDNESVIYRIVKYPSPFIGFIEKQMIWNTQSDESKAIGGQDARITNLSNDGDLFLGFDLPSGKKVIGALQADGSMRVGSTFQSPYGNGALTLPDVSPDQKLVISGNGFGLHAWEFSGNATEFLGLVATDMLGSYGMDFHFSPDGKILAFTNGGVAYLLGVPVK